MSQRVRAKFYVSTITQHMDYDGNVSAQETKLKPVYSSNPESENHAFWKATPSGDITMFINNADAFDFFAEGGAFYVDFESANDKSVAQGV